MTFTYQSSFWEHYHANAAVLLRIRSQLLGYGFMAVVGVFLIGIQVALSMNGRYPASASGAAVGAWFVVLFPFTNAIQVWSVRRRNRIVGGEQTFAVGDEGIRMSGAHWDGSVRWDAVVRVVETSSFLLFYFSPRFAYYVPKRVMSAADLASVRALVAERGKAR